MAGLASGVSNAEQKRPYLLLLVPEVIGELFGDFVIVADALLDKPGAC